MSFLLLFSQDSDGSSIKGGAGGTVLLLDETFPFTGTLYGFDSFDESIVCYRCYVFGNRLCICTGVVRYKRKVIKKEGGD
jgi:hypothetical protein